MAYTCATTDSLVRVLRGKSSPELAVNFRRKRCSVSTGAHVPWSVFGKMTMAQLRYTRSYEGWTYFRVA